MSEVVTLGSAADITAISPDQLANTSVFASLADLVAEASFDRLVLYGVRPNDTVAVTDIDTASLPLVVLGNEQTATALQDVSGGECSFEADPLEFLKADQASGRTLVYVGRAVSAQVCRRMLRYVMAVPGRAVCFSDYLVWLPEGEKNEMVREINRSLAHNLPLEVGAYIMDPYGRPKILVRSR